MIRKWRAKRARARTRDFDAYVRREWKKQDRRKGWRRRWMWVENRLGAFLAAGAFALVLGLILVFIHALYLALMSNYDGGP